MMMSLYHMLHITNAMHSLIDYRYEHFMKYQIQNYSAANFDVYYNSFLRHRNS